MAGADNAYAARTPAPIASGVDERLAGEPDLRERIVFKGEVSDERSTTCCGSCHIFCAPSRYESFGLMNVEAMK